MTTQDTDAADDTNAGAGQVKGTLLLVATPIGNLDDLSFRAARSLVTCDVIYAEDTRTAKNLMSHISTLALPATRRGATVTPENLPSVRSLFEGNENAAAVQVIAELQNGKQVVYVSEAGMPGVSDPGERLVRAVVAAGYKVTVVPGPSAPLTALVASGLPTSQFLFAGFLPRDQGARQQAIAELANQTATLLFFEAPDRVAQTLADLHEGLGDRQACVAREMTKMFEQHIRGTLGELRGMEIMRKGEFVLVVAGHTGPTVDIDIEAEVRALLASGLSAKDVAGRLMVKTGKPRRQLYQLALSLAREQANETE